MSSSAKPLTALRAATDDELIRQHDAAAKHTSVGIDYYLEELHRRDLARSTRASQRLAVAALILSVCNLMIAVVAVVVALSG